jgi:hypothetical protein
MSVANTAGPDTAAPGRFDRLRERVDARLGRLYPLVDESTMAQRTVMMTLVVLVLYAVDTSTIRLVALVLTPVAFLFPRIACQPRYWAVVALGIVASYTEVWHQIDNHKYLINYWCVAVALSLFSTNARAMLAWNARVMIGLCFGFATAWKLMAPEFPSGLFFHFTFMVDRRFHVFSELVLGVTPEMIEANMASYEAMKSAVGRETVQLLASTDRSWAVSRFLAVWTIVLEGWIAIAFLAPRRTWLGRTRNLPLLLFMATTYPIAPVRGFAALLATMGFTNCEGDERIAKLTYLLIFLLVPLLVLLLPK